MSKQQTNLKGMTTFREKTARINTGRQKELDIARGLAVIFMILIHIVMNLMFVAFVGAWLGICYGISNILPASVMGVMKKFSTNVTVIYVIQYILIIYIQVLIVGETVFSAPIVRGIAAVYTLAAYWGAVAYKKLIATQKAKRTA